MRITEFDGEDVTYEAFTPPWTFAELDLRDQQRRFAALEAAGLKPTWTETERTTTDDHGHDVVLPGVHPRCSELFRQIDTFPLMEARAEDERENRGWQRSDGKQLHRRFVKAKLEAVADQLGVPTGLDGWEEATLEALRAQPARGVIGGQ